MASSACLSSPLNQAILNGDDAGANEFIDLMLTAFDDKFWLEIMPHDHEDQYVCNMEIVNIGQERGIGLIATADAHYPWKEWSKTHDFSQFKL
jgi:DNA polymerase III alpha subunit